MSVEPSVNNAVAALDGTAALPRKNGELVFDAPWEGRVFGLAVSLSERNHYVWDEFRDQLIAEIGQAEAQGDPSTYYERWLASFERLLLQKGLVSQDELDARTAEYESGARE
jgi:nitrile hydratase accessory protein